MAIDGFIFLLVLGIYLCITGILAAIFYSSLTGKFSWTCFILVILGIFIVEAACYSTPFTISFKV